MTTRVAIYARVSTTNGQDVSMQTRELRQFVEARGWQTIGEYIDAGVSGAKDSRPELNRLMADAKRRTFDVVLVWKLDRFGRSLKHLVAALGEFEALGVAFVSLRDSFDLTTPAGRLMFNVVASFAEFERDLIRERVKAGIANRRAKGLRVGRKPVSIDPVKLKILRSEGRKVGPFEKSPLCSVAAVALSIKPCRNCLANARIFSDAFAAIPVHLTVL